MKKIFLSCAASVCLAGTAYTQSGQPDPSFGNKGIVATGIGSLFNYGSAARQVLTQADGSIYILLDATIITKRLPNGSIDSAWGFNGYSRSVPLIHACAALQPDGKVIIAGSIENSFFGVTRIKNNGTIDSAFGNNGIQVTEFDGFSHANSVAIQSDGKIVVAGNSSNSDGTHFALARYTAGGMPDNTFNGSGHLITDFGSSTDFIDNSANTLAIQADGKIIAAGYTNTGNYQAFAIARYNTDGSLDKTFDKDGRQTTQIGSFDDVGYSLAIQKDGKLVLAGYTSDGVYNHFAVARYTAGGSLDKAFNGNGKQTAPPGSDVVIGNSVAIQQDGKIVIAGNTLNGSLNDFAVVRFNTDGSIDNTFDNDGMLSTDIASSDEFAGSVAVQRDNKIIVAGYADISSPGAGSQRFALTRYNANGTLDNTFGIKGKLEGDYKQGDTRFTAVAIQPDGKVLAAGTAWNGSTHDFAIARYNNNGGPDNTFDHDGEQITDFGADDNVNAIVIQKDGKIVVAGNSGNRFALARYNTNGSPDNTFGSAGKISASFGFEDFCQAVAVQTDGKIVVAGYSYANGNYDTVQFAVARFKADGTPDNSFGTKGQVLTNFGSYRDFATSLAIQTDGKIVVAGRSIIGGVNNFSLARYNIDGSADNTFSYDGKQNSAFDGNDYFIQSIAIQKDGKIVAAGYTQHLLTARYSFAVARYNADGELDNTFSRDGLQITETGAGFSFARSVTITDDGRIAVGGTNDNYTIVLYKKDGNPDSSFGRNGISSTLIGTGTSAIEGLAFANNRLYAAGSAQFPGTFGTVARYLIPVAGPLPVSLISFNAITQNHTVVLQWQTENEKNFSGFSIQRSSDSRYFSTIGAVNADAASASPADYVFTDRQPAAGLNYYRLKMTDADGEFSYSKIIAVNIQDAAFAFRVFPNPATDLIYVEAHGDNEKAVFTVIDGNGKKLQEIAVALTGNTSFSIPVNSLPKGIYYLQLHAGAKTETKMFVKQ